MHGTIESALRVEWRPLAELSSIAEPWRRLAGRALEPNVFYEPAFALAAAPVFGRDVGGGLVWSQANELVGLFPAHVERRRYGVPLPVLVGWTHPYAPLGVPLVDRDAGEAVLAAWLDHIARDPQLPGLVLLPFLPSEGALARALLAPAGERATYLDTAIGGKRRKELNRLLKRLGDSGAVTSVSTGEATVIAPALDDFLALEAGGWKGRVGTAARRHPEIAAFMHQAVGALAAEGKAQVGRLRLDDRAIAAMVTLRSGATAWGWKIAYDERYARFSPGVQILRDVTQRLLDDPAVARADSCATADHPMIDHIWRERLTLADLFLCAGNARRFPLACGLEQLRRAAIAGAKAIRDRLRKLR